MVPGFDGAAERGFVPQEEHPELAVIVPTYNERSNVGLLYGRLCATLAGVSWEMVFVDDDSPDGTAETVRELARRDRRVRLVHRIGRRGLSSACIEGMLATAAPFVAVMDADLQHDETILPAMLEKLRAERLDLVVATRNAEGGSMGAFSAGRVLLSRAGQALSRAISRCAVSDPMSGFFLLRRPLLDAVVHGLSGNGFKILLDILANAPEGTRAGEVGYRFGRRQHGTSKLDLTVSFEYVAMIVEKLTRGVLPTRVFLFLAIGGMGVLVHFACLSVLYEGRHVAFTPAQGMAAGLAMVSNFFLNDLITFRDRRLKGMQKLTGLATFCVGCAFGACANVALARTLLAAGLPWFVAAFAGIVVSAGWNYSISSLFTWRRPQTRQLAAARAYPESLPLA